MSARIEDYALIGDCQTAALVSKCGSIDWLCFPRFDSAACFAALVGLPEHGHWSLAPKYADRCSRRYRPQTLILETKHQTDTGSVLVCDFMPPRNGYPDVIRTVIGETGEVMMRMEITIRFDYGLLVPWVRRVADGIVASAGPESLQLHADIPVQIEGSKIVAEFPVVAGQEISFILSWHPSNEVDQPPTAPKNALAETERWWSEWISHCTYEGIAHEAVERSLITLKALTYAPTGGIVAAATTSLPEHIGGVRNWDYRYCWLRDATLTLYALLKSGYRDEAKAWREWLVRAIAGDASQLNIMYGVAAERRLPEMTLSWLPGYEGSTPVRIGNAAFTQFQLDVFGEVMDTLHLARKVGLQTTGDGWRVEGELLKFLEVNWDRPDEGIWEVRGPRRYFTHSQLMAWVAFDRAVKDCEEFGLPGPVDNWRAIRDKIHSEICTRGFNTEIGSFVQSYGGRELDASLLMMPMVGFLPPTDPRIHGTVAAIEKHLTLDGFVFRYADASGVDGLPPGEGTFIPCSFWLADNYAMVGRHAEAHELFERLLAIRNDVGLLAEEYDPRAKRQLGNFPQAFSHIGLINSGRNLSQLIDSDAHREIRINRR